MHKFFPIFVDLTDKNIVVVGGGKIAKRRIQTLLDFCPNITLVADCIEDDLKKLAEDHRIQWKQKRYEREDILDADFVLACTDDKEVNGDIYAACKCLGITVNDCSDRRRCDFYFPGIASRENVVVGVTASGTDHRRSREVTESVQAMLDRESI